MNTAAARALATVSAAAFGGLAMQPVLIQPSVMHLAIDAAQAGILITSAAGCVLLIGRTWSQLVTWHHSRPPDPERAAAPLLQFAAAHPTPTLVIAEANHIDADPTNDHAAQWRAGLLRFCLIASPHNWGWREMCRHTSRADWEACNETLAAIKPAVWIPARGRRGAEWAEAWSHPKFRAAITRHQITPPYPDSPPPIVNWKRTVTQRTHGTHGTHTPQ